MELSSHLLKRMIDRDFNEVDLRRMLEDASGFRPNDAEGRWIIETGLAGRPWEVIGEPEDDDEVLVVITAYPID